MSSVYFNSHQPQYSSFPAHYQSAGLNQSPYNSSRLETSANFYCAPPQKISYLQQTTQPTPSQRSADLRFAALQFDNNVICRWCAKFCSKDHEVFCAKRIQQCELCCRYVMSEQYLLHYRACEQYLYAETYKRVIEKQNAAVKAKKKLEEKRRIEAEIKFRQMRDEEERRKLLGFPPRVIEQRAVEPSPAPNVPAESRSKTPAEPLAEPGNAVPPPSRKGTSANPSPQTTQDWTGVLPPDATVAESEKKGNSPTSNVPSAGKEIPAGGNNKDTNLHDKAPEKKESTAEAKTGKEKTPEPLTKCRWCKKQMEPGEEIAVHEKSCDLRKVRCNRCGETILYSTRGAHVKACGKSKK